MKKIHWFIHTGFVGANYEDTIELSEDYTDEEIDEYMQDILNEYCQIEYWEENND